ncbi:hypothetical protein GCM10007874_00900 [Labrys miyagiensis]|uniref:Uncharacterized protein n=1 Tax=Labrys miyagiensis TaxID=346912 RepID=A0ABQ6CAC7_9HYPH|nr:hypothetical protein GCM10007874_00900 [Labrys miyagiensis]
MKTPIKPFVVEVKRSRSGISAREPVQIRQPILAETIAPPVPASHTEARQLAEQAFRSLTTASTNQREEVFSAENVFRAPARPVTTETSGVAVVADEPPVQMAPAQETAPSKLPEPRAKKVRVATAPAKKGRPPKAASAAKAPAGITATRTQQDPPAPVPKAFPPSAPAVQVVPETQPAGEEHPNTRQSWGWGPGERWKKRLRHLR